MIRRRIIFEGSGDRPKCSVSLTLEVGIPWAIEGAGFHDDEVLLRIHKDELEYILSAEYAPSSGKVHH